MSLKGELMATHFHFHIFSGQWVPVNMDMPVFPMPKFQQGRVRAWRRALWGSLKGVLTSMFMPFFTVTASSEQEIQLLLGALIRLEQTFKVIILLPDSVLAS